MAVLKCKMCGGTLEVQEGATVCECEYCGSKQTIPTVDDEGLQTLYNRANMLRMKSEFDKASELYEKILQKKDTEAEAYWGLILCKYGIEYVEDPKTYMRVPTCHRTSYEAVTADEDYKNALKYAEIGQRVLYEDEAKKIDEIQKGILAIAQKEDPYDVFICYKETDDTGKRTPDSVIANDIYHQLTQEGFKVFYAAITLEDKLGTEYEPYIFSALNTSKVMLAIGTKPEYFNAVWVKNEWSRFLKAMKKDRSKLLIPCYRDMDPYELPEEFAHLQAQDMSKIGFINDIVRGIKKVIVKESPKPADQDYSTAQQNTGSTTASAQIKRGNIALEDHEWEKADSFFEEALNLAPESAEAYIGKLLAKDKKPGFASWIAAQKDKNHSANAERLEACPEDTAHIEKKVQDFEIEGYLDSETIRKEYKYDRCYSSVLASRKSQKENQQKELASERFLTRAKQYAKGDTIQLIATGLAELAGVLDERIAKAQQEDDESIAHVKEKYAEHIRNADKKVEILHAEALKKREDQYEAAEALKNSASDLPSYEKARDALKGMRGYKDSDKLVAECQREIDRLKEEKQQEEARIAKAKAKKKKTTIGIISVAAIACVIAAIVAIKVVIPNSNYNKAVAMMENGEYESALAEFEKLGSYKDSQIKIEEAQKGVLYNEGVSYYEKAEYTNAIDCFSSIEDFKDSKALLADSQSKLEEQRRKEEEEEQKKKEEEKEATYTEAVNLINNGNYDSAYQILIGLKGYKDVESLLSNFYYIPYEVDYMSSHSWPYKFDYSDQGLMEKCTVEYSNGGIKTIDFDQDGLLSNYKDTSDNIHSYKYEADRIYETSTRSNGEVFSESVYDQYGNLLILNTLKEHLNSERKWTLDEHNNIYSENTINTYDSEGNLVEVSVDINNMHRKTAFQYRWIYNSSAPESYEAVIWRNIRLVCGEDVWQ